MYQTEVAAEGEVALKDFSIPENCTKYPQIAHGYLGRYLNYTTFVAQVWINYDSVEGCFFDDKRAEPCGKLILSDAARKHLESFDADVLCLKRVVFEITTPFRPIAWLGLKVENNFGELSLRTNRGRVDVIEREHPHLFLWIDHCAAVLRNTHEEHQFGGINLHLLDKFAMLLRCRWPAPNLSLITSDAWVKPSYGFGDCLWTDREEATQNAIDKARAMRNNRSYGNSFNRYLN